ncbi:hypothetical protein [Armatimonas rosea]|uniref:Tfp pilus assembly protein PilO n=1 Tax=Armatimonas rosea TaxID=685828 RepID=A0A7W9SUS4_ARMRO|nr:hypothetical protein [Armatimonas rosea]MBB6053046.1 Tfp pilus assembly protein PilO [Armatimonas rosea]
MKNSLINFKNPQEVGPSAVTLAALLILAGSLAYMLFVPKATTDGLARGKERSRKQILEQIESAQASGQAAQAATAGKLWQGDTDTISAAILAQLTQEANLLKVKVSAFRPQRTLTLPELTELPFTVQLAGPYPAIQAFAASFDRPSSKLALRSIQLASSDASSDAVTATLGISAYVSGQVTVAPKKPTVSATPAPSKGGTSNGQAQ